MFRVKSFLNSSLIAFLFISITSSNLFAQDSISLAGKYALQFQISQNFTLGNFLGSVISGSYHLTNTSSVRIGLSYTGTMDNTDKMNNNDSLSNLENTTNDVNSTSIDLMVQYLVATPVTNNILFYWGAGPRGGVIFSKTTNNHTQTATQNYANSEKKNGWSAGAMASAGVEWFFSRQMSLLAEYGISYLYTYTKTTTTSGQYTYEIKEYNYSLGGSSVRFGLSVYF